MTNREILKNRLNYRESKNKYIMEDFIENKISEEDIQIALSFLNDNGNHHKIANISYSENGNLNIKLETGITFLK
jgi:hypothetical protein